MPAYLQLYQPGGSTLLVSPISTGPIDGGTTYVLPCELWNDNGGTHGDTVTASGITVSAAVSDGVNEQNSGDPLLDQAWVGLQVTGMNNAGDSTMVAQTTPVVRVGSGRPVELADISKNCSRSIAISINPPPGASNATYDLRLHFSVGDSSVVLAFRVGAVSGCGILPDWLVGATRRLTRGRGITASGTDTVVAANGSWDYDGSPITQTKQSITLNQTDGASAALTTGNAYKVRLSQPKTGSITVTKGSQGATPAAPAVPANEINLGIVNVSFQSGGTSIINQSDVDTTDVVYGSFLVTAGSGLNAIVHAGNAISSADMGPFDSTKRTVGLTDNSTNSVWLNGDGSIAANTTGAAPAFGSQLLAIVTTVGGAVTAVQDSRQFVGHAIFDDVIELRQSGTITVANDVAWDVARFDAAIMAVGFDIGKLGTGASSGSFIVDIPTRAPGADLTGSATTIFTSFASDDQRPTIAFNATNLSTESRGHEVTTVMKGTRFALNIVAVPASVTGTADVLVRVYLRRLR